MQELEQIECESCSLKSGRIKFNNKTRSYLCDYCEEEYDSLLYNKPKLKSIRERDLK